MILEAILYFVLGFLSAGLLALMVSPAIWNRAVVLTKRKIESSVPLTLNEIQADKDQLRAEFAMSTRRLEISVEELREKAAGQLIEINRKRDEVSKLDADSKERLEQVEELEARSTDIRSRLAEREVQYQAMIEKNATLKAQQNELKASLEEMEEQLSEKEDVLTSQRIELVTRDTQIDNLNHTLTVNGMNEDQKSVKMRELKQQIADAKADTKAEKARTKEAERIASAAQKDAKTAIAKLEARESDLGKVRSDKGDSENELADLNRQLVEEKSKTVELEARLATQALQTEALLVDASNENVQAAMQYTTRELEEKSEALKEIQTERDKLTHEVNAFKASSKEDWASERHDNAILRERINDMAAQIAVLTASMEGENSPINEILDKDASNRKSNGKSKTSNSEDDNSPSLASRIRAIQQAAGSGR